MGSSPGLGGFTVAVQDRVLLMVWVLGWGWAWVFAGNGGREGGWVRHGTLSDVDVAAIMAAAGMLAFSFAPAYTFIDHRSFDPTQCTFTDSAEQLQCTLDNFHTEWSSPTGYNAWHQATTALPVALVIAVGLLVALRAALPLLLPAILVRLVTRVVLLIAGWVIGWAVFNPSGAIFQGMHYGWGLWGCIGCLLLMSLMAVPSPPRFLAWLVN